MAENANEKKYLDQTGLNELVTQIKSRYDGSFVGLTIEKGNGDDTKGTYLKFTGIDGTVTPIDASQFVKDGMLDDVKIITSDGNVTINGEAAPVPAGEKLIQFIWNTDAGDGKKVDYLRASEIGKVYEAGAGVNLDGTTNAISVKAGSGVTVGTDGVSVKAGSGVTVDTDGVSVKTSKAIKIDRTDDHGKNFLEAAFGVGGSIPAGITFEEFINRIARIEKSPSSITITDTCSYTQPTPTATWPKLTLLTGYTGPAKSTDNYVDVTNCILKSTFDTSTLAKSKSTDGYTGYFGASFTFPNGSVNKPGAVTASVSAKFSYGYQKDAEGDGTYDVVTTSNNATDTINVASANAFTTTNSNVSLAGTWNGVSMGSATWNGGASISVTPSTASASLIYGTKAAKYTVSGNPYSAGNASSGKGVIPGLKNVGYKNLSSFLDANSTKNIEVKNAYAASSGVSKTLDNGSFTNNDYVFNQPTNTTSAANMSTSQNYTGIYPIFMNIIPEGKCSAKLGATNAKKTIINKSSLITNITDINLSNIVYDSANGTYKGSNSLLVIPNSYITTDAAGNTTIILGDSGKGDSYSTDDKTSFIPYLKHTGDDSNYKLLIAVPSDVTVKVSTPDANKADVFVEQFSNAAEYTGIVTGTTLKVGPTASAVTYKVYNLSAQYNKDSWVFPQILVQLSKKL